MDRLPRVCREDIFPPCNSQEGLCSSAFLHCYQIPVSITCNKKGLFRFIVLQAQGQDYQAVLLCACSGAAHDCGMCMCGEAGPITLYDGLGSLTLTEALPQRPRDFPWCLTSERIYYLLCGFSLTHVRGQSLCNVVFRARLQMLFFFGRHKNILSFFNGVFRSNRSSTIYR